MQIAEWLRDIADNQVEPSLRQQGLLDQLARRGTDVQVLNDGDIIQTLDRQLEGLIRDGRPQTPNAGTLECAAVYWAQGLILAKAVLHGLVSTRPAEMEQLQQGLENVLVDVFRRNQLIGWLSNPMDLFASCKNRVGAAVSGVTNCCVCLSACGSGLTSSAILWLCHGWCPRRALLSVLWGHFSGWYPRGTLQWVVSLVGIIQWVVSFGYIFQWVVL